MSDEDFMREALAQAHLAASSGEVPVGAVVVRNGLVIATGRNALISGNDPTAHAEIVALRAAAGAMGNYRLDDCELFITLEPCAMCSGALLNARLKRVVFGATEPKTGAAGSVINLFSQAQLNHQTTIKGGVLAQESRALLQQFFQLRRADQRDAARQRHPLREDALRTPDGAFEELAGYEWSPNYLSDLPSLAGLRLHFIDESATEEGKGRGMAQTTFLCVHDSPYWGYYFSKLIPSLLNAGHRVVVPDLIGFGKSDKPKKEAFHTLGLHRQILLEFVERLDLNHVVMVLPGKGGRVGMALPSAAPTRFQGLMVFDAGNSIVTEELPLSEGLPLWHARFGKLSTPDVTPGADPDTRLMRLGKNDPWKAPFPDKGFLAGVRALDKWTRSTEICAAIGMQAEQFWSSSLGSQGERSGA